MNARGLLIGLLGVLVMSSTVYSASGKYTARLNVKGDLEKDRDSSKNESDKSNSKTKSETQQYELEITAANTIKQEGTFSLEWYFFKRPLDKDGKKGDPVLCEKGKTSLTIGGMKRVTHKVMSKPLTWKEVKSSKSGNNKSSNSSSSKIISGDIYDGYVILLRAEGDIIAQYSSEKKFLSARWLGKMKQ